MSRIAIDLCLCGKLKGHDEGTSDFFVSVIRNAGKSTQQTGLVLGPYATHDEALTNVDRGRAMAERVDPFTAFDAFGTIGVRLYRIGMGALRMKRSIKKPDLPPVKPTPDNSDPCVCFGRGAWYDYKTDPVSIKTCGTCEGVGYLVRTHPSDVRCPDRFPGFCSSCGCRCFDCQRARSASPKWSEFEAQHSEYPGNGNPGKFVAWGTDPFRTQYGGIYRIAIFQPWPTAGLVWHVCDVDTRGKVATVSSPYYRSSGAFYDRRPEECTEHLSGSAVKDATASAHKKMQAMLS